MKKTYQAVYFCNLIQGPYKLNSDSIYMLIAEVKASAFNVGDLDSIPGLGRSPGEGNGNTLQYSCLENLMDRGAWQATVHGVAIVRHDLETKSPPPSRSLE